MHLPPTTTRAPQRPRSERRGAARRLGLVVAALALGAATWFATEQPQPFEAEEGVAAWCRGVREAFEVAPAGVRSFGALVAHPRERSADVVAARLLRIDHAPPQAAAWQDVRRWLQRSPGGSGPPPGSLHRAAAALERQRQAC